MTIIAQAWECKNCGSQAPAWPSPRCPRCRNETFRYLKTEILGPGVAGEWQFLESAPLERIIVTPEDRRGGGRISVTTVQIVKGIE